MGDRAIEIGAVRIRDGDIVERFQSLMNPGQRISGFIEDYTGITNAMLANAPTCAAVLRDFTDFCGNDPLVAHNASFDKRFLDSERSHIGLPETSPFACTLLLARRLLQDAPNHQLGTLVSTLDLPNDGTFHRALADAEMTAHLWLRLVDQVFLTCQQTPPSFALLQQFSRKPIKSCHLWLKKQASLI
jgi:DNA polymerase-3 subunit epsilon